MIPELLVTFVGLLGLAAGLVLTYRTYRILRPVGLQGRYWILGLFIGFFILGYLLNTIFILGIAELPIGAEMMVSLVYLGGAIYVVLVSVIGLQMWRNVVGVRLTDEEALERFEKRVGNAPELALFLDPKYAVPCDMCGEKHPFSLYAIVCTHATNLTRGIEIQSGMGSKMIQVFPRHMCIDGMREIPVRLDGNFEYRSHSTSRPI